MKINKLNKGIFYSSSGSFFWGFLGTYYFQYITLVGAFEVVVHRCIWTALILLITTLFFKKWKILKKVILDKKKIIYLFITSILIFGNWSAWIYAVSINKIIDASIGYFIFPILSVFFGYIFFKEKLNKKRIFSILLVIISILIMIFLNIKTLPWVGIIVALSWAFYNLVRKKIDIETDIGLLIESLYIFPFALIVFYFIFDKGLNDFSLSNPGLSMFLLLAGPMTVIPLFLYVRGVELIGLGATGMIFYITPTLQFILGYFYYNEDFSLIKLVSFIIIWIAVIIYLKDLYETN